MMSARITHDVKYVYVCICRGRGGINAKFRDPRKCSQVSGPFYVDLTNASQLSTHAK